MSLGFSLYIYNIQNGKEVTKEQICRSRLKWLKTREQGVKKENTNTETFIPNLQKLIPYYFLQQNLLTNASRTLAIIAM